MSIILTARFPEGHADHVTTAAFKVTDESSGYFRKLAIIQSPSITVWHFVPTYKCRKYKKNKIIKRNKNSWSRRHSQRNAQENWKNRTNFWIFIICLNSSIVRFYLVAGEAIKRWCQVTILSFSDRLSAWNYDPFLVGICQCDKADDNIKCGN